MKNETAETAKKTEQTCRLPDENTALDRRYRQIGISAVAAAARYQGVAKNPAYAPAPTQWRGHSDEAA